MDEPTIGIDPVGAQELRDLVPQLVATGVTVLLTTHYMFEADQLCDTIAIINNGSLVALGTPREIKQGFSKVNVAEATIRAPRKGLVEELGRLDGVQRITSSSDGPFQRITLYTGVGVSLDGRVQDLVGQDNLEQFVSREPTLEEAYISILN
jgi:ABC-2 type transport system ATP-binding protein